MGGRGMEGYGFGIGLASYAAVDAVVCSLWRHRATLRVALCVERVCLVGNAIAA